LVPSPHAGQLTRFSAVFVSFLWQVIAPHHFLVLEIFGYHLKL